MLIFAAVICCEEKGKESNSKSEEEALAWAALQVGRASSFAL